VLLQKTYDSLFNLLCKELDVVFLIFLFKTSIFPAFFALMMTHKFLPFQKQKQNKNKNNRRVYE